MSAIQSKRGPGRPRGAHTLAESLGGKLRARASELLKTDDGTTWPSSVYRQDPARFAREVLGIILWSKQIEIIEAVRDNLRVAICSGRKVGKTELAAVIALWYYCSYPDARVWLTAPTMKQVTRYVWRSICKLHAKAIIQIDGSPRQHAGSGLTAPDLRQILGFTAATREDVAGASGADMLYIVDEASGVADEIYEAIEGNRAGGDVRLVLISNGTKAEGEFFRAFTDKADFYKTFRVASTETPNYLSGERTIPGLATREWVEEMKVFWGEESFEYKVHVLGEHVEGEQGKIFSLHTIEKAEEAWEDASTEGPLVIGLDPAGAGVAGDETVFAPRRNHKILALHNHRALTAEGILVHLNAYIADYEPDPSKIVLVVVDGSGAVGAEVCGVLRAAAAQPNARFRIVSVRSGEKAQRQPLTYYMIRDELFAALEFWIKREGGGIPEHARLAKDMHCPSWGGNQRNLMQATPKDEMKKILGRSPDYLDACCLSVWMKGDEPGDVSRLRGGQPTTEAGQRVQSAYDAGKVFSPY